MTDVNGYLSRWRKYQSLWIFDKVVICEKFANHDPPLVRLDEKFLFYAQLIEDLRRSKNYQNIKGIRINLAPLIDSICDQAMEWIQTLGRILVERNFQNLLKMKEHIQLLRLDLDRNIRGLTDFKTVMATVDTIQTTTLSVEIKIRDMQETYSVLEDHKIHFEYTDMMMAYHLEKRWKKLYNSSMNRGVSLAPIKKKFADMTCVEIEAFTLDVCSLDSFKIMHDSTFLVNSLKHLLRPSTRKDLVRLVMIWTAESSSWNRMKYCSLIWNRKDWNLVRGFRLALEIIKYNYFHLNFSES